MSTHFVGLSPLALGLLLAVSCKGEIEGGEEAPETPQSAEVQTNKGQFAMKGQAGTPQLAREEARNAAREAGVLGALSQAPAGQWASVTGKADFSDSTAPLTGSDKEYRCPQACERLSELAMQELDRTLGDKGAKLKAQVLASRDRDQAHCVARCTAGHLKPKCVQTLQRLDDLAQCKPKKAESTVDSAQALSSAQNVCGRIVEGAEEGKCSKLAAELDTVNKALRNTKGAHEDDKIDRCVDTVIDLSKKRCKSDQAFKRASDYFMMVMLAQ